MRTLSKWIGLVLLVVVMAVGALAAYIQVTGIPRYAPGRVTLAVEATPARVERGRTIARSLCAECHMNPTTGQLTGKLMSEAPPEFGPIVSRNITQDRTHGIGDWTDGELVYVLRTGVTRDGRYLPPPMPKLVHMSDEDLASVVAFLRSDDPLVQPAAVDPPGRSQPSFLIKFLTHVAFTPEKYPTAPIPDPPAGDQVALGRYINTSFDCYACHSADFTKMDIAEPEKSAGFMGGGNTVIDIAGRPVRTANLTMDPETGIGAWTEEQFVRTLRSGIRPDGRPLRYPMVPQVEFTDRELSAVYAYLKTVPVIRNDVPRNFDPPVEADAGEGQTLYYHYQCVSCHGDTGVGIGDLRQSRVHYPSDQQLELWIRDAPSIKPHTKMPKWDGVIKDSEFPAIIAYVRELGDRARKEGAVR